MTRNIAVFLAAFLLSIPFVIGINRLEQQTTDFFLSLETMPDPELLGAKVAQLELKRLVHEKPYPKEPLIFPGLESQAALSLFWDSEEKTKVLFEKNADLTLSIASITKLMTALVVLEHSSLDQQIHMTPEVLARNHQSGYYKVGESFFVKDLLYPLLMESSNEAAHALAQQTLGEERFVREMNTTGQRLQLSQTSFINPTGLTNPQDNATNYSTANDLAKLAMHLIKQYPQIFDILSQKEFDLRSSNQWFHHKVENTNILLDTSLSAFKIIGGKTGWTPQAQGTLLLVAQTPQERGYLINVLLGTSNRFGEMKHLLDWVFQSYKW